MPSYYHKLATLQELRSLESFLDEGEPSYFFLALSHGLVACFIRSVVVAAVLQGLKG